MECEGKVKQAFLRIHMTKKIKKIRGIDLELDDNYHAIVLLLEQILGELRRLNTK